MQSLYSKAVRGIYAVPKQTWFGIGITLFLWWIFMHYTRWPAVQEKSEILTVLATGAQIRFGNCIARWVAVLAFMDSYRDKHDR